MSDRRPPHPKPAPLPARDWQHSTPPPPEPPLVKRAQPPLKEVLKGLDARELEGQTVFDQLFGDELPVLPAKKD